MPSHEAFLKEITAHPEDLTPRLVYADWLDEEGDPRGEFIRVQCELATLDETDDHYPALLRRERELLAEHRSEWLRPLKPFIRAGTFRCGFVEKVKLRFRGFLREGERLAALTPLRMVSLTPAGTSGSTASEIPGSGVLKQLVGLEFHDFSHRDLLPLLKQLPELPMLKRVMISKTQFLPNLDKTLAELPVLRNVTSLLLPNAWIGEKFLDCLSDTGVSLRQLDYSGGWPVQDKAQILSRWVGASQLATLIYNGCRIRQDQFNRMIRSINWSKLRHLELKNYQELQMGIVANEPTLSHLIALSFLSYPFQIEAVQSLVESPYLKNLRRLTLGIGKDYQASLELLSNWPQLHQLTHLRLIGQRASQLSALFRSPYWNPKTILSLIPFSSSDAKFIKKYQTSPPFPEAEEQIWTTEPIPSGYLHDPVGEY